MVTGPSGQWSLRTSLLVFLVLSGLALVAAAAGAICLYAFVYPAAGFGGALRRLQDCLNFLSLLFENPAVRSIGKLMVIAIVSIWGACAVWVAEHGWKRFRKLWSELPRGGGTFLGEPKILLLGDGRKAQLSEDFSFRDCRGQIWTAPAGSVVDGASIPRVFWRTFGSPFVGLYRNASIIHDYYCENRCARSSEVHRMFYEACLAGGLPARKARLAYWAVRRFGPYWGDEAKRVFPALKKYYDTHPPLHGASLPLPIPATQPVLRCR